MYVTTSLGEIAGHNARRLRQRADKTLQDVAHAARFHGLNWSSGSVSDFESGRAATLDLARLFVVAAVLSDVTGEPVRLADLFIASGSVNLNAAQRVGLAALRKALSGEPVPKLAPPPPPHVIRLTGEPPSQHLWDQMVSGTGQRLHQRVYGDFREADERLCKKLGVSPEVGAAAMARLWEQTFVAERDQRAGPGANAQKRGRVAQHLRAELQEELSRWQQSKNTKPAKARGTASDTE